ncbi:VOC family protein [Terrilactibacillus laevilacticus]|uniref:VOC family protein n=1 Tax=Terrilactibacillus laevilacticus TaxID=1380157 RepID=UPI001FE72133|nr:VOC family protein [Terrilactibacillus laevilacticus]
MEMKHATLYETHVQTTHLERVIEFYQRLDMELAIVLQERRVAFFWFGGKGDKGQMLGVWEVNKTDFVRKHFAFKVNFDELKRIPEYLKKRAIPLEKSFGLDPAEPFVHAWMPSACYYFKDPDGNSLEYLKVLEGESRPELGVIHLSQWERIAQHPNLNESRKDK